MTGKAIVITGAGTGLGRALARRLAAEGNRLFLLGRNAGKLQALADELDGAVAIACDVGNSAAVEAAFAEVARHAPRIDVLINNAGSFEPAAIAEASDAHIRSIIDTNLVGAILCSRAALAQMGSGGQILNIGSETVTVPVAMLALYQASKAGLERFSQTLDEEAAPRGIRVTLVRAGKMYEPGMAMPYAPELHARFAEANARVAGRSPQAPLSLYASVAAAIVPLLALPDDVHVPHITLAGRSPGPKEQE